MSKQNLKALSVIMLALLWSAPLLGQSSVLWQKSYGGDTKEDDEIGYAIQKTSDGGFIIVGMDTEVTRFEEDPAVWKRPETNDDFYLLKTDSKGTLQWEKSYGGPGDQVAYGAKQTSDGGYIIVGEAKGKFYLMKTDSKGDSLWTKTTNAKAGRSVVETSDGHYIVAGWIKQRYTHLYLLKTDSSGTTVWEKDYEMGYDLEAYSIIPTSDGGYMATGWSKRPAEEGYWQLFFVKTDVNGDTLWTRYFGGDDRDEGHCVVQTSDGGYLAAGRTGSFSNHREFYVVKIDSKGDSLWAKHYGVQHYAEMLNSSVVATGDGKYLIIGSIDSSPNPQLDECGQVYIVKIDGTGKKLWSKYYGKKHSSESAYGVVKVSNGYVIVGSDYPNKSSDGSRVRHDSDLYLLKISR